MKSVFALCAIIAATFFASSSFAKPQVTESKDKNAVAINTPGGIYVYLIKEKKSEFLFGIKINGVSGVVRVILDKNDKPQHIMVAMKNGDGKYDNNPLPKSDPQNAKLYEDMEKYVAKFVKENGIKKILRKYKK